MRETLLFSALVSAMTFLPVSAMTFIRPNKRSINNSFLFYILPLLWRKRGFLATNNLNIDALKMITGTPLGTYYVVGNDVPACVRDHLATQKK